VKATSIRAGVELTTARQLQAVMQGGVVTRSDDDYARTRQVVERSSTTSADNIRGV
jgi:hypothetical protein